MVEEKQALVISVMLGMKSLSACLSITKVWGIHQQVGVLLAGG